MTRSYVEAAIGLVLTMSLSACGADEDPPCDDCDPTSGGQAGSTSAGGAGGAANGGAAAGGATASCDEDLTLCGDACVNLKTDAEHCGACFEPCEPVLNGTVDCVGGIAPGTCAFECNPGYHASLGGRPECLPN